MIKKQLYFFLGQFGLLLFDKLSWQTEFTRLRIDQQIPQLAHKSTRFGLAQKPS